MKTKKGISNLTLPLLFKKEKQPEKEFCLHCLADMENSMHKPFIKVLTKYITYGTDESKQQNRLALKQHKKS